jgi:hypothetical protein
MGKKASKKDQGSSSSAVAEAIPAWAPSDITMDMLAAMERDEVIPEKAFIPYATAEGHEKPFCTTAQTVIFLDFFRCGFRFPASSFFASVLHFYGVEICHLNPNSFVMLSVFAHLCEAYLGTRPRLNIFRYFYYMKPLSKGSVGAAGLRLREGASNEYITFSTKTSWSGWHKRWFYCEPPPSPVLKHRGLPPLPIDAWQEFPRLSSKSKLLLAEIAHLKAEGLTAWDVAYDFIKRRLSPLKSRVHGAWEIPDGVDRTRDSESGVFRPEYISFSGNFSCF